MTMQEIITQAIKNTNENGIMDNEERLNISSVIALAYHFGKEVGVKEASDLANDRFHEQQKRARKCRYHRMAAEIVGEPAGFTCGRGFTCHPDYSQGWHETYWDCEVYDLIAAAVEADTADVGEMDGETVAV